MADTVQTKLRSVREYLEFSRELVARRLDPPVTARTIDRWERGTSRPKRYQLLQLATIYGVDVDQLDNGKP
jgi:transcriptional regulator with XRE-family HTH domain